MYEHTVTVEFDDEQLSIDNVIRALNDAGYTVPEYSRAP
jgi:copper chaperone CopZ